MSKETGTQNSQRPRTKAGRTLLVKPTSTLSDSAFSGFTGLTSTHHTDKSNSYFLTFDTPKNALDALRNIKKTHGKDVRVKFAHYRVFFKVEGLTDSSDYNTVKTAHTTLVQSTGANVLYYRLYRKNNSYLNCGDFTIDTKEGFDALMNSESLKAFTLEGGLTGTHYRYRRDNQQGDQTSAVTANA